MIPQNIFKAYDIRAIYPDELNEENIYQIVQAVLRYLQEKTGKTNLTIVAGKDMRLSAPSLYPIFLKALTDGGAQVVDIDMVSTPSMYFAVFHYGYDAGIQLTASHNPPNYNGIKMVLNSPKGLIKIGKGSGMEEVKNYAVEGKKIANSGGTVTRKENILEDEVENAMKIAGKTELKPLKVVADPANAMGATYIDALYKKIPGELIRMNFHLDGSFPSHQPNPLIKTNLKDLQAKVLEEKADVGLAPDGDGDRMFFIDEKGQIVPASHITALIARELLKKFPGSMMLYDVRYILTPERIIKEFGGTSNMTKVGHAFITAKMHETGAVFGGESSGHYFFKETGNAESQLPVILIVLSVISREGKPLSEIIKEIVRSSESGEYNFKTRNTAAILEELKKKYADGALNAMDGIAITYKEWRFGVRSSNTEPLLRLNIEADTEEIMRQKLDELVSFISSMNATLEEDH